MSRREKFLYRGHTIKRGDKVKAINSTSGETAFYQVERVWGSHAIMRAISEEEAGSQPLVITIQPEVQNPLKR